MGESSTAANVTRLLAAFGRLLPRHGFACDAAAGVAAAEGVYRANAARAAS
jgi:aspartate aminotransferase-like enzyme